MFSKKNFIFASLVIGALSNQLSAASLNDETLAKAKKGWSAAQKWDCGPRAVSMSLAMLDSHQEDVASFVNSCPQSLGSILCPETAKIKAEIMKNTPELGSILPMLGKVGPFAKCLAEYASDSQEKFEVQHGNFDNFDSVLSTMETELNSEKPVIIKVAYGLMLHYLIVIGIDIENKTVTILNSEDESTEVISFDQLQSQMNIDSYVKKIGTKINSFKVIFPALGILGETLQSDDVKNILSGYNIIRFAPKTSEDL